MSTWKKQVAVALFAVLIAATTGCTPYQAQGGAAGGAIGGISGALLDSRNPWRGGVIGAAIGAIAGATIADISARGAQEAVVHGRPVEYRTEDGRGRYYAEPVGPPPVTRCRKVRERVYEDGRLVRDHIREVCEGERYERGY
jgi:glycine zipper 2TM protein